MPRVKVKWSNNKTTLEKIDLNLSEPPALFKAQLFALTNVPVERQKLMFKGSIIQDNNWPEKIVFNDGDTLMLMGSSEKLPEAPVVKPKFIEDMDDNEFATALSLPAGLTNLGNTCYMSATVQCLKTVPELVEALSKFDVKLSIMAPLSTEPNTQGVTAALRDLYHAMGSCSVFEPLVFVRMVHNTIPRFMQKGEGGGFQQQDANECWTELTRILQQNLKPINENSKYSNAIDEYFSGNFEAEMRCDEAVDEPISKSNENFLQLSCFISQDVRYLLSGLMSRLTETITKFSPSMNRDATYTKTSRITRLPAYLTIQFVRFHYKGNVQTNAKLLRDVKFSMKLDIYDLCSKDLQEKLAPMRAKYKEADDKAALTKSKSDPDTLDLSKKVSEAKERFLSGDLDELKKYTFPDDPGSNNSGFYELKSVLTHKGRSSSSGHYVGWIKQKDRWFKCDDDLVDPVDEDEVLKLSGGGDWHCAYVLLYGPRYLDLD